ARRQAPPDGDPARHRASRPRPLRGSAGMSARLVFCEGPDDVAALREIALHVFGAKVDRPATSAGPAGQPGREWLRNGPVRIEIRRVPGAKSAMPGALADWMAALAPQTEAPDARTR